MSGLATQIKLDPPPPAAQLPGASKSIVGRGLFRINLATNLSGFAVSVLVGLWFTPYLIRHLGIAAYGLIPLVTAIISYLNLVTLGLNSAVGRYLLVALEQGDSRKANQFFNTSLAGSGLLVVLLLPVALWLSTRTTLLFHLPPGQEQDTALLFIFAAGVFLLATLTSPFEVAAFCRNRFDLRNIVQIGATLLRVGLVVIIFGLVAPKIWQVGLAAFVAAGASLVGVIWIWRKLMPQLSVAPGAFNWLSLKELASTGGWIVLNYAGALLFYSIDLLIINRMLGAEAGGWYAVALQWTILLRGLATAIAAVFGPTIFAYYAQEDLPGLVAYSRRAVKLLGLVIALPIGLVCGLSYPILTVWLGSQSAFLAPLMSLMTIHLCINLSVLPLFNLQIAKNRVRGPGIVTGVMGAANLGLAIFLTGPAHWGLYGVAAAGAIMLTAKNAFYTPLYGAYILKQNYLTFVREIILICGVTGLIAAGCWWLSRLWDLTSWHRLVSLGLAVGALYGIAAFFWLLSSTEKKFLRQIVGLRRGEKL